jgi:hypothetical protein
MAGKDAVRDTGCCECQLRNRWVSGSFCPTSVRSSRLPVSASLPPIAPSHCRSLHYISTQGPYDAWLRKAVSAAREVPFGGIVSAKCDPPAAAALRAPKSADGDDEAVTREPEGVKATYQGFEGPGSYTAMARVSPMHALAGASDTPRRADVAPVFVVTRKACACTCWR